jgi:hypothetical protein
MSALGVAAAALQFLDASSRCLRLFHRITVTIAWS